MSGSKNTVVDDKVIWRETLHQFLLESMRRPSRIARGANTHVDKTFPLVREVLRCDHRQRLADLAL